MNKVWNFVNYLRRGKKEPRHDETGRGIEQRRPSPISSSSSSFSSSFSHDDDETRKKLRDEKSLNDIESTRILRVIESILFWENSFNSIIVIVAFHIIFWGIVVLEIRGFAAASSAALFAVLGYNTFESQIRRDPKTPNSQLSPPKVEQITKIVNKANSILEALKLLRKNRPGVFCVGACAFSVILWLIGNTINGIVFAYAIGMSILLGPALSLRVPCKLFSPKELCHEYSAEWDTEIEEFLPAVTEDSLEVLQRAGDTGEHYPAAQGAKMENQIDPLNEDELIGLRMPSHEDGSTDGLDVSELELSNSENDADSIKIQSEHFEPGSSSDEEAADLVPESRKLPSHDDDESDSEFEIIDSREIAHLDDV